MKRRQRLPLPVCYIYIPPHPNIRRKGSKKILKSMEGVVRWYGGKAEVGVVIDFEI